MSLADFPEWNTQQERVGDMVKVLKDNNTANISVKQENSTHNAVFQKPGEIKMFLD